MVGIIEDEDERESLLASLSAHSSRLWSALSCWEAVAALKSRYQRPAHEAEERVLAFADTFALRLVPIAADELGIALEAFRTYGKGNHRAKLNFGDCFAYACAKTNGARLLYKGTDFSKTDLA